MRYKELSIPELKFKANYYFENRQNPENPKRWTPHLHDKLELYVLIEGDVSFSVESTQYKLKSGDAIITKPNEIHNCILNTHSVHRHICFWFDTDSQFIFDSFSAHEFGKNNLIRPGEGEKAALNKIYEKLKTASESEDNYMKYALIIEMLSILRKFVGSKTEKVVLPSLLHEILADIDKSFTSMCNLDYLTAKYYISQSTLNRMFRTHLCTTPKIYVETKKLAHSRKLLKEGKSVSFAARESGFNNVSNYIRLFKKRFGITPNEYKQQQRKKSE